VVDSFITFSQAGAGEKLQDADLADLVARGHEIGGHSTAHRQWNPDVVSDEVVAWGVDRQAITQHLPSGYEVETLAWPFHLHDTRMTEIARDAGYLVGRNGGIGWGQYKAGSYCSWDSCRIYEVGLTCEGARITSDETATRTYIRECVREAVEHGNGWINLYAHTADGRYDGIDITRQEMIWVIDELVNTGRVWIETMGEVARYYRQRHSPAPWDPMLWVLDSRLVAVDEPPIATGAQLQNQPNPFNARTAFAFSLPSPGRARLEIYDLAGRLVAVPVDADLPAGSHESIWDGRDRLGRNLGSGQYVYRLMYPDGVATSRLLLIK
jgi:hypothetical protein